MSQTYAFVAIGALIIALILLFLYNRAEAHEASREGGRQPLPGKLFILILIVFTFVGMAITEWQGACGLSQWGFVAGSILGAAAEIVVYLHPRRKNEAGAV